MKENLRVFLEKLNINMDISNFSITPLKGKKVVSKVMSRYTDQSIGIYKLTGNPELLNLLYAADEVRHMENFLFYSKFS